MVRDGSRENGDKSDIDSVTNKHELYSLIHEKTEKYVGMSAFRASIFDAIAIIGSFSYLSLFEFNVFSYIVIGIICISVWGIIARFRRYGV